MWEGEKECRNCNELFYENEILCENCRHYFGICRRDTCNNLFEFNNPNVYGGLCVDCLEVWEVCNICYNVIESNVDCNCLEGYQEWINWKDDDLSEEDSSNNLPIRYCYNPFPEHQDHQIKSTRKRYVKDKYNIEELTSCFLYSGTELNFENKSNRPAFEDIESESSCLIFLNAHGDKGSGVVSAKYKTKGRKKKKFKDVPLKQLAYQMVVLDRLPQGNANNPVFILCLACESGGYIKRTHGRIASDGLIENIQYEFEAPACQLSIYIAEFEGYNNVFVGGYPGKIVAKPGDVGTGYSYNPKGKRDDVTMYVNLLVKQDGIIWFHKGICINRIQAGIPPYIKRHIDDFDLDFDKDYGEGGGKCNIM